MEVYEKIVKLNHDSSNYRQLQRYLLACCASYKKYRSSGDLENGLNVASKYIDGRETWKKLHRYEWELEGEAFGIEYYIDGINYFKYHPDKAMLLDLRKIRIQKRLNQDEALEYLDSLAYFIVYVFSYCYRASNDLPPQKYAQFLCPKLFNRFFCVG